MSSEIREYAVDVAAVIIVIGVVVQSYMMIQTSPQLDQLGGVAAMYLFGKYTPNSQ